MEYSTYQSVWRMFIFLAGNINTIKRSPENLLELEISSEKIKHIQDKINIWETTERNYKPL
jgi:hypothetical protein